MNDNVLLIGASGFVGTRLLETAIADFNIKNLDKQQSHFYPEITQIGDVRDQQALDQALAGFDTVVLLAAEHRDDVSPTSSNQFRVIDAGEKNRTILCTCLTH